VDKHQPVQSIQPLSRILSESVSQRRSQTLLLGLLAAAAVVLAAVGIYGVIASLVLERTHEIGVRMAVGAQARDVFRLVLRKGMWLAIFGAAIGLAGALVLTRILRSFLFEISPTDPLALCFGTLLVMFMTLLACWLPAVRATRIQPLEALRHD
jgi:putative ABC transport system permease protein